MTFYNDVVYDVPSKTLEFTRDITDWIRSKPSEFVSLNTRDQLECAAGLGMISPHSACASHLGIAYHYILGSRLGLPVTEKGLLAAYATIGQLESGASFKFATHKLKTKFIENDDPTLTQSLHPNMLKTVAQIPRIIRTAMNTIKHTKDGIPNAPLDHESLQYKYCEAIYVNHVPLTKSSSHMTRPDYVLSKQKSVTEVLNEFIRETLKAPARQYTPLLKSCKSLSTEEKPSDLVDVYLFVNGLWFAHGAMTEEAYEGLPYFEMLDEDSYKDLRKRLLANRYDPDRVVSQLGWYVDEECTKFLNGNPTNAKSRTPKRRRIDTPTKHRSVLEAYPMFHHVLLESKRSQKDDQFHILFDWVFRKLRVPGLVAPPLLDVRENLEAHPMLELVDGETTYAMRSLDMTTERTSFGAMRDNEKLERYGEVTPYKLPLIVETIFPGNIVHVYMKDNNAYCFVPPY